MFPPLVFMQISASILETIHIYWTSQTWSAFFHFQNSSSGPVMARGPHIWRPCSSPFDRSLDYVYSVPSPSRLRRWGSIRWPIRNVPLARSRPCRWGKVKVRPTADVHIKSYPVSCCKTITVLAYIDGRAVRSAGWRPPTYSKLIWTAQTLA